MEKQCTASPISQAEQKEGGPLHSRLCSTEGPPGVSATPPEVGSCSSFDLSISTGGLARPAYPSFSRSREVNIIAGLLWNVPSSTTMQGEGKKQHLTEKVRVHGVPTETSASPPGMLEK